MELRHALILVHTFAVGRVSSKRKKKKKRRLAAFKVNNKNPSSSATAATSIRLTMKHVPRGCPSSLASVDAGFVVVGHYSSRNQRYKPPTDRQYTAD